MTGLGSEIRNICREWDIAIQQNDLKAMSGYMADDWVIIGTEGGIIRRSEFLERIRSGVLVHTTMDFEEVRVRVYGEAAVATARGTSRGSWNGHPFSYFEWSTSTFVRQNGKWMCVLTMLTPAEDPPSDGLPETSE